MAGGRGSSGSLSVEMGMSLDGQGVRALVVLYLWHVLRWPGCRGSSGPVSVA